MPDVMVSIIIPVYNGEYWLTDVLNAIANQTLYNCAEIIIIDSGSTDNSLSIAKEFNVNIISIPSTEFNHGSTRNLGIMHAVGEFVVMTVQDAIPSDNKWLEKLVETFSDEKVVAVCGQQVVPHNNSTNPVAWYRPVSSSRIQKYSFLDPDDFNNLQPLEKKRVCGWDNVNAIYRRDVMLNLPFRHMLFAEDAQWAIDAILSGYTIAYNPTAIVYHYHHEPREFAYKRTYIECYSKFKLFGLVYDEPKIIKQIARAAKILMMESNIRFSEKAKWLRYNWNVLSASRGAIIDFNKDLKVYGDGIDDIITIKCGVSPMAQKPTDPI